MLNPRFIDRDEAPFKRAAIIDAQKRSTNAKSLFSTIQITRGIRMYDALSECYRCDEMYLNYRPGRTKGNNKNKFIAIKFEGDVMVANRKKLKVLMDGWKADPSIVLDPIITPQGLTYRLYFT